MNLEITLSPLEIEEATHYAREVATQVAKRAGAQEPAPGAGLDATHLLGFKGQRAFCSLMGLPWSPQDARGGRSNVGSIYKIKSRLKHGDAFSPDLRVMEFDADSLVFVHMVTSDGARYRAEGWIKGRDAKRVEWWREGRSQACYCVPARSLNPMETLPADPSLKIVRKTVEAEVAPSLEEKKAS